MATPSDSADAGLLPGTLVAGRFRIEAALGRGGMATVYRAIDERTGRALALKRLRAARDGDGPAIIAQLEREYHTLCQLTHPSIIAVHDYGIEQGTPYYTMELLEGDDLHRTGKLPWPEACAILRDVASSLAVLHSRRLLHRDISTRNVRRTHEGRAKLIDFGAMMVMGVSKQTVGTPPFMPPEAVQLQSLDGRADLYSLGALAYFLLTGYHAYHARSVSQLRTLWRSPALPVREYEQDVPAGLDALVSELLQFERATRPARAAEVIERLSAIAGLPLQELPEVTRAYLLTPQLVGRKPQLEPLQDELRQALSGAGRSIVLQGEAGSGRSRLLDAGVLEAKLQGAVVLRADAADALGGDFGVARALCQQLLDELPELHERGKEFPRAVLGHVVPQWRQQRASPGGAPPMRALHGAFRAWFTWIARDKPLVVAIDDFEATDPPSAALLATLAQAAAQSHLLLLLTTRTGVEPSGAQLLVQELAQVVSVPPLDVTQSEALLRSVFGDIAHVAWLSSRIHALARGNPRATLALCERLVERGAARYEAGGWELPATLAPADIPDSLATLLAQRIASLRADARELAEALAVTDPAAHHPSDYVQLTHHHDAERCYRALDALVAAELLVPLGDRYRFGDEALPERLRQELGPQRIQELHGMIAVILPASCDPLVLAYHLLRAGCEAQSVELLVQQPDHAFLSRSPHVLATLEHVVTCAERIGAPLAQQTRLRESLVGVAALRGDHAVFTRYAWPLLARLQDDSGLRDYLDLEAEPDCEARHAEAQRRARRRHDDAPERERPLAAQEAAYRLGRVYGHIVTMAGVAQDYEMVTGLPSLAPLYRVVKAIELADIGIAFQRSMQSGDAVLAKRMSEKSLQLLEEPETLALSPDLAAFLRRTHHFIQGLSTSTRGNAEALHWCAELQHDPRFRVHAWRVRMVYELMLGNPSMASACQRRAELLHLQDTGQLLPGTTVRPELTAHVSAGDLLRVKRTLETIKGLADAYPGWRPTLALARSHYYRLQGDLNAALEALASAFGLMPGRHIDCAWVWASQVTLLSLLGRTEEALARALEYRAQVERLYGPTTHWILEPHARALSAAGRLDEASHVIEHCIELMERAGMHGLVPAAAYETAARIALGLRDQSACTNFIALCARQYRGGSRNPLFNARYELLAREAQACGLQAPRPSAPPVRARVANSATPRSEPALVSDFNEVRTAASGTPQARAIRQS